MKKYFNYSCFQKAELLKNQNGLSLIELMIAMSLGVVLLFGVLQIFDANRASANVQQSFSEVQQSGRMAVEFLARDIRMADYYGCSPDTIFNWTDITNPADPNFGYIVNIVNQAGLNAVNDAVGVTIGTINVVDGTDVITLRGSNALSNARIQAPFMPTTSAALQVNVGNDIELGEILLLTDCEDGELFANTANNVQTSGTLTHNSGSISGVSYQNTTQTFSKTYDGSAQLLQPYEKIYFVGENVVGGQSLYRALNNQVDELIRDVEDLQFLFGEDVNSDGSADVFGDADVIGNLENVVSVRANITVSNVDGDFTRSYPFTANIRNRSL
ncbi:PilW family protein [Marinibactrum halimedae]|uniref:Pilus assembly protein PilW n=1 Tax=Marinibactrum halimedae TaxID=1444977 RepID=A0AA37WNT9_9GAMM|nr:PilW family protein [Marinibactrum halimedae]MCD9460245.1 PilW family protein [Marinibactrum halimedae]GLS27920.1 pilus assembly protein PilW [Marinibactrum halimedae]